MIFFWLQEDYLKIYFYLQGKSYPKKDRETERKRNLLFSALLPKALQWKELSLFKAGSFFQVSTWVLEAKNSGHPVLPLASHKQGAGSEEEQPGHSLVPIWDTGTRDCLVMVLTP